MKSILQEIYFEGEEFAEKIPKTEEYNEINFKCNELFEKLLESANTEQKQMLEELFYLMGGLQSETGFSNFKAGFNTCMQLVFEGIEK